MNMRASGSRLGGLTPPTDKRIGDAFPIIEAVYKELDKLKYIAEHSDKFAKRDVELRANMDLRSIEWRYKDQDDWLLLITFSDLVQVDLLTFEQDLHAAVAEAQGWANHAREVTADVDKIIAETHQARDQAIAAASSTGIFRVFKTKAEAEVNIVAVPVGKYIEVLTDESYNGCRTRYEKTVNGYIFAINLDAAIETSFRSLILPSPAYAATTDAAGFMSAADKTKLDDIEPGVNVYTHPASHPPSIIAQDANNRFVTDAEKAAWGGKAEGTHSHAIADLPVAASGTSSAVQLVRADDSRLSNAREWTASEVTQAEAEAGTATTARKWTAQRVGQAAAALAPVKSVAGKTGVISLVKGDVGLGNADNTADSVKSVASAATLTTARTIGGVSFDGSTNINLPGVNAAGNQNTTGNAATATKLATARTINGVNFDGTANITVEDATKEPSFAAGTTAQYFRGDKTWRDFFTDVRAAALTGLSTATNAVVSATDTVLSAIGKLQAQVSAKFDKSGGAISGNVSVAGSILSTSGALGYGAGAGGNATQPTDKASPVNLHKPSGRITMNSAGLAGNSAIAFVVNNSVVGITDTVVCNVVGGTGDVNAYTCSTFPFAGGFYVSLRNMTSGSLTDAVQIQFNVIKGVTA